MVIQHYKESNPMSCFILSDESYTRARNYLKSCAFDYRTMSDHHRNELYEILNKRYGHVAEYVTEQIDMFFKELQNYNTRAFFDRYGERAGPCDWHPLRLPLMAGKACSSGSRIRDLAQVVKTLQCADYQAIDSDEYTRELSPITNAVTKAIADWLIEKLPDYQQAQWG